MKNRRGNKFAPAIAPHVPQAFPSAPFHSSSTVDDLQRSNSVHPASFPLSSGLERVNGAAGDPSKLDYFLAALARGEPPQDMAEDDDGYGDGDSDDGYDEYHQCRSFAGGSSTRTSMVLGKPSSLVKPNPMWYERQMKEGGSGVSGLLMHGGNGVTLQDWPLGHTSSSTRQMPQCDYCNRFFRSSQGLGAHKRTCKVRLLGTMPVEEHQDQVIFTENEAYHNEHGESVDSQVNTGSEAFEEKSKSAPRTREPPFVPTWHVGLAAAPCGHERYARHAKLHWLHAMRMEKNEVDGAF